MFFANKKTKFGAYTLIALLVVAALITSVSARAISFPPSNAQKQSDQTGIITPIDLTKTPIKPIITPAINIKAPVSLPIKPVPAWHPFVPVRFNPFRYVTKPGEDITH